MASAKSQEKFLLAFFMRLRTLYSLPRSSVGRRSRELLYLAARCEQPIKNPRVTAPPFSLERQLFHISNTQPVHHRALTCIHELFVDLDMLRCGRQPMHPVDAARIAELHAVMLAIPAECSLKIVRSGHSKAIDFMQRVHFHLSELLAHGEQPALLPGWTEEPWTAFRSDLNRCQEPTVHYLETGS